MKKLRNILNFIHHLVTCPRCHGLGYRELPNGDTIECGTCAGKGYI